MTGSKTRERGDAADTLSGGVHVSRGFSEALLQRKVNIAATQIAEVSLCGAIPPYNELLLGKLAALGRKAGLIMPLKDHGGWGKHLCLSADTLEALVLMYVVDGQRMPWKELWKRVTDELGLLIGVGEDEDRRQLREAGVLQLRSSELEKCAANALHIAIERGLARRLPDEGAEVSGRIS